jgi:hypothetical protein
MKNLYDGLIFIFQKILQWKFSSPRLLERHVTFSNLLDLSAKTFRLSDCQLRRIELKAQRKVALVALRLSKAETLGGADFGATTQAFHLLSPGNA